MFTLILITLTALMGIHHVSGWYYGCEDVFLANSKLVLSTTCSDKNKEPTINFAIWRVNKDTCAAWVNNPPCSDKINVLKDVPIDNWRKYTKLASGKKRWVFYNLKFTNLGDVCPGETKTFMVDYTC